MAQKIDEPSFFDEAKTPENECARSGAIEYASRVPSGFSKKFSTRSSQRSPLDKFCVYDGYMRHAEMERLAKKVGRLTNSFDKYTFLYGSPPPYWSIS